MTSPAPADSRLKPALAVSAWLAAQHAEDQQRIADHLALGLFPLWAIMRFTELDASTVLWLPAVLPRVETAFLQSQRLAAVFNANVRFAELPVDDPLIFDIPNVQWPGDMRDSSFTPPDTQVFEPNPVKGVQKQTRITLQEFPAQEVATSLTIEANYNTKAAMPGPEKELMHDALVRSSGAAVRQAMNGGRGVTDRVMKKDRKVIGYARVTDADPCAFCALLASQGTVFGKGSFIASNKKYTPNADYAKGRELPAGWTDAAKVHNNCRCTMRPVYSGENLRDEAALHYFNIWKDLEVTAQELMDSRNMLSKRLERQGKKEQFSSSKARKNAEIKKYKELLKDNPFTGSQYEMAAVRQELRDRKDGLLNAGFSEDSPQVRWVERTSRRVA